MDQIPRQRRPSLSIELSPLIDCVFLLLIFFMLSSTMLAPAVDLDLPNAALAGDVRAPEVVVTVDRSGRMFVNAEEIEIEELADRLRVLLSGARQKLVTYRGDAGSDHATFVRVLEAAQVAGAAQVEVAHDTADGRRRPR